jgi:hypothetical protein
LVFKFVTYVIIAYLALWYLRRLLGFFSIESRPVSRSGRSGSGRPGPGRSGAVIPREKSSVMVRCESCGTFLTQGSALMIGGKHFCSSSCVEQKARKA